MGSCPQVCLSVLKCRRTRERRDAGWLSPKGTRAGLCISGPRWTQPGGFCVSVPSHEPGKMWVSTEMLNEGMNYVSSTEPGACYGVISRGTGLSELPLVLVKVSEMPHPRVGSKYLEQGLKTGDQPGLKTHVGASTAVSGVHPANPPQNLGENLTLGTSHPLARQWARVLLISWRVWQSLQPLPGCQRQASTWS